MPCALNPQQIPSAKLRAANMRIHCFGVHITNRVGKLHLPDASSFAITD